MGSPDYTEIFEIRGRKHFGQEAIIYAINTGNFKEDFVERKRGK